MYLCIVGPPSVARLWCIRRASGGRSPQPRLAFGVQLLHRGSAQPRHVHLHREAVLALQIAEVFVPVREGRKRRLVELERRRRTDDVETILFVDGLAADDGPLAAAAFEEIVETS